MLCTLVLFVLCLYTDVCLFSVYLLCFVYYRDDDDAVEEISSMPGQARYGINKLRDAMTPIVKNGLKTVLIFGVPQKIGKVRFAI